MNKIFWKYIAPMVYTDTLISCIVKFLYTYANYLRWREWHKGSPEWFDHRIDLHQWPYSLNPHWLERAVYSKEVMSEKCAVLDIACGDGFYAKYFYVSTGAKIDAIDINMKAITHAKKYNAHPRIRYFLQNALAAPFPRKKYDVICFDGAIDHFTEQQLDVLLKKIRGSLSARGVMTGYQEIDEHAPDQEHPIDFPTIQSVKSLFRRYFKHVQLSVTKTPCRVNTYIKCFN